MLISEIMHKMYILLSGIWISDRTPESSNSDTTSDVRTIAQSAILWGWC